MGDAHAAAQTSLGITLRTVVLPSPSRSAERPLLAVYAHGPRFSDVTRKVYDLSTTCLTERSSQLEMSWTATSAMKTAQARTALWADERFVFAKIARVAGPSPSYGETTSLIRGFCAFKAGLPCYLGAPKRSSAGIRRPFHHSTLRIHGRSANWSIPQC